MMISDFRIKRPSVFLFAAEGVRALVELGSFYASQPLLKKVGEGDGHPVLVLPGFMASDRSTQPLRQLLNKVGYDARPWDLGVNYGSVEYVDRNIERIQHIYRNTGRKISIIGWSLGGVYAREIARQCEGQVRQVITLGSPFGGLKEKNNASWLYRVISGQRVEDIEHDFIAEMLKTPSVPTTAIYTKGDGIVSWQHCIELEEGPHTQNVQVKGSHCGLGVNPSVILCVMDRLAQLEHAWQRFEPEWYKGFFYPNIASLA